MDRRGETRFAVLLLALSLLAALAIAPTAIAHVEEESGSHRVELGWADEPPLVGSDNLVEVEVTDAAGRPVAVPAGALSVEVSYAGSARTLPLLPAPEPGRLTAELVPTRPGSYAFHVSGTVGGERLDVSVACGESTFECVESGADVQFPVVDPSNGELAQRLGREAARAEAAGEEAEDAKRLALVALALAAVALALSVGIAVRRRRKSSGP